VEAQVLKRVNEVSATLVRTPGSLGDLDSVLRHIAVTAQGAFDTDACVILAFNPITSNFIGSQIVVGDLHAKNELLHGKPRPNGVTQQVLSEGIVLVQDLDIAPQYQNEFTHKEGICSFAGLAMLSRHRKRPLGVIYLDFRQPKEFSSSDYENFSIFVTQAALLLQETWLERHLEEVARIGQEINQNLESVEDLFQELQRYVENVLDESHTLVLGIYQSQTNTLDLHIKEQKQTRYMNIPLQGTYKYVMESQKSRYIKELSSEAKHIQSSIFDISTEERKQRESLIVVPLTLRGVPLGILSIQHAMPNAYGKEDHFVLQLLANYIALALHNFRLYSSLTELIETGQILTQQLKSEQTLDATVEKIKDATRADVVVLFPYEPVLRRFILPQRIVGNLLDPTYPKATIIGSDDIAVIALNHKEPIFAKDSDTTYAELRGFVKQGQENFKEREKIRSVAVVPLGVGEEAVGVLFVNFRQAQRFDSAQKLLIEGLAHYAAIAIKNAQVFDTLIQRRIQELEILQKIDRELSRTLELETVLNTLLKLAHEQVPAEEAAISLYNSRTQVLESTATFGRHAEVRRKVNIPLQATKGITRWVLENKKPVRVANVHLDLPWRNLYLQTTDDTLSELDLPLFDGEEIVGVLNFESTREGAFRQEDEDFLLTLAGQAVLAIKNAQAYEREKRLVEEGQVLNEISKEITSQLDLTHVFDLILEKALELTHSTTGELMIFDPNQNDLWMAAERGVVKEKKTQRLNLNQGVVGYVARTKQLLIVDPSQAPWNEIFLDFIPGTRSELTVPMLAGNELRGVLNVESSSPNNFNESDERLLRGLADLAVVALQNARAYEREKRLAQESQVLNDISKEITSQLDHVSVFNLILDKALDLTHSTLGSLHLYNAESDDLRMMVEHGVDEEKKGLRQKLGQGIVGYAAQHKQLQNIGDVTQHPWNEIYIEFVPGAHSEMAVPLLAGDELRGILNIESPIPNKFTEHDERLLRELADLAVIALLNAEHYQKAEKEAERFELLYQAGQELSKITSLEELEQAYEVVVQIAGRQSQSQAVIYRYDETNEELILKRFSPYRHSPLFERIKSHEGLNGQVARERRTIVIHDANHLPPDVISIKQSDPSMYSFVVTPILFKDQYYGNLGLRYEDVGHYRGTDIHFFEGLAQQLASTIYRLESAQARQEFEQRALASEEMSSIGQSAFEVTHRLGNDLGLVNLYISDIKLELEHLGVTNEFVSKKLENIRQSVQSVLSFSGELKQELAKLGAKEEMAGELVLMSPRMLLDEALAFQALSSSILTCLEINGDVADVQVFPSLVADILRNLVVNAIQAMPEGGAITLRGRNAGRYVALEVSDTGVGIPQEKQSKVFDLFFSTKGSSGFGLWSARRNALKNHGDLKVESKPGQGTTFTLLLQRADLVTL
jgi:GAF domain-containing protein